MSSAELPNNPRGAATFNTVGTEFERTPPQDLQAEQSVLGGMLLSKDAFADVVEVLRWNQRWNERRPSNDERLWLVGL